MNPIDLIALFGAGIASFIAPCVVPLVPAYLGMMAGEAADGSRSLPRAAFLFVAGFSTVFVVFGLLAGHLGSELASVELWLQRIGGTLIVILGALLIAAHHGRGPRGSHVLGAISLPEGRTARPLVMGWAFGAAWTPCVGPLLGAALVVAADSGDAIRGGTLLLAYSLGIGLPFIAIALAADSTPQVPALLRRWSHRIEPVAAIALVTFGVLLAVGIYDRAIARVNLTAL